MDSYKLKQEIVELQKELEETKRQHKIYSGIIEGLHKEQMKYLQDIPVYKKQASDAEKASVQPLKNLEELMKKVSDTQREYDVLQKLVIESKQILDELTTTKSKVIKETNEIQDAIKNSHADLIERHDAIKEKEKSIAHQVGFNQKMSLLLNKREVDVAAKEKELSDKEIELLKNVENHNIIVEAHGKKVDVLIEQKQFLREDQQEFKDKSDKLNGLIKDNENLKEDLLKQSSKLSEEIKKAEQRQVSLDKSINDLKNEEKRIKIMELKVLKIVKDANLDKEFKDLMEFLK